jgi:O-antigen/teichoic acid export membrane protein
MIKRIVYNTAAQLIARTAIIAISLVTTSLLTRRLGTEDWGSYVFLTSFVLLLASIADWGTGMIAIREASRARKKESVLAVLNNAFFLRLFLMLAALLLGFGLIFSLDWFASIRLASVLAILVIPLLYLLGNLKVVFHWQLKMDRQSLVEFFSSFSFLLLAAVLLWQGQGLVGVIAAWLGARVASIILGKLMTSWAILPKQKPKWKILQGIFKKALPLGAFLLLFTTYDRGIDVLFLRYFWNREQVGFYGLSYKIYGNLILPAYFFSNSIFPILSKITKETRRLLWFSAAVVVLAGVAAAIVTVLLAPFIISLLGGEQFTPSVKLLQILSLALPFAFFNHVGGFALIAGDRQGTILKIGLLAVGLNLLLNWIFIPRFAAVAASWVTLVTEGVVFVATLGVLVGEKKGQRDREDKGINNQ